MEDYILNAKLPDKQRTAEHLAGCPRCLALYLAQSEEQARWSQDLYTDALPDAFTAQVMALLEDEEIEPSTPKAPLQQADDENNKIAAANPVQADGEKPAAQAVSPAFSDAAAFRKNRFPAWKVAIGAASLLVLLFSVAVYSVPTLAEALRSLFGQEHADIGLLRAQELGLVEHPNIRVTDRGYTLKIDEAVADPTRVVVALQLFGPSGQHDRERLVLSEENTITIKDGQGKPAGSLHDIGYTNDFYYLVAHLPEPLQTDHITIEGRLTQLGNNMRGIPVLSGDWSFNFSIDLTEANKKTTVLPLSGSYTSPDGMTVRLKRLTRMVQGVRLEIDTELSADALARSPGELWKEQGLRFHFENAAGEEIHSVNTRINPHMDSLMTQLHLPGDKPGLMHSSYTFKSLPADGPYTFVFDGYFVSERDGASVSFEPAKLKTQPVVFQSDGDELLLQDFTVESPPNTNGDKPEGSLQLSGLLRNENQNSQWILTAPGGQPYPITMRGVLTWSATGWQDGYVRLGGPDLGGLFEFRASGLAAIPEQLQLTRTVVSRMYTNVAWSVPMPETEAFHAR
ncbi:DUF4179 domain-containing protein [Paenibacillus sp. y28]